MKWNKRDGGVQHSSDRRYVIMRATTDPEKWVAYSISVFGNTADRLCEVNTAEEAREWCELHEPLQRSA